MRNIRASKTIKLIFAILACQIAGVIGSIFTAPSIPTWYATLRKPDFSPPNWVFAPVWTFLFVLMGVWAYLVWNKSLENKNVKMVVLIFSIQLVLNMLWSFLFFRLQSPLYAFFEIIVLWLAIVLTILNFLRFPEQRAGCLFPT